MKNHGISYVPTVVLRFVGIIVFIVGGCAHSYGIELCTRASVCTISYPASYYLKDRILVIPFPVKKTQKIQGQPIEVSLEGETGDKVLGGGVLKQKAVIKNTGREPISISAIEVLGPNAPQFFLESRSFPITIGQGKQLPIDILFKSVATTIPTKASAALRIAFISGAIEVPISATILPPLPSGATISLTDTQIVLGLSSSEYSFIRDYSFKNTSEEAIEITDAKMFSGRNNIDFVSFVGEALPITVEPGEKVTARLSYNSPSDGSIRYDKLVLVSNDHSFIYPVQAIRKVPLPSENGMANRQLPLSVAANSESGTITVKLYAGFKGEISIYNASGALVANQKNTMAWSWKATSNGKSRTKDEEYVIKVTAVDSDGSILTRSERSTLVASK